MNEVFPPVLFRSFLTIAALSLLSGPISAQGTEVDLGTSGHDQSLPVEITSDQLNIDRQLKTAVFTGNVVVGQGAMRLFGDVVDVFYVETIEGDTEVEKVHASGNVRLFNGVEAAEGEEAIYTVSEGTIVMTGDVILTQGENAMAGEKLTYNVDTGTGFMEGRVQVIFNPESAPDEAQ